MESFVCSLWGLRLAFLSLCPSFSSPRLKLIPCILWKPASNLEKENHVLWQVSSTLFCRIITFVLCLLPMIKGSFTLSLSFRMPAFPHKSLIYYCAITAFFVWTMGCHKTQLAIKQTRGKPLQGLLNELGLCQIYMFFVIAIGKWNRTRIWSSLAWWHFLGHETTEFDGDGQIKVFNAWSLATWCPLLLEGSHHQVSTELCIVSCFNY